MKLILKCDIVGHFELPFYFPSKMIRWRTVDYHQEHSKVHKTTKNIVYTLVHGSKYQFWITMVLWLNKSAVLLICHVRSRSRKKSFIYPCHLGPMTLFTHGRDGTSEYCFLKGYCPYARMITWESVLLGKKYLDRRTK